MGFKDRIVISEKLVNTFTEYCVKNNIEYAFTGRENLIIHSEKFIKNLKNINLIRYQPDIIIIKDNVMSYIELKNSKYIEKTAYDTYIEYAKIFNVGIVFLIKGKMHFSDVNNLKFKKIYNTSCPIIDNIWQAPRQLSNYAEWQKNHPHASGTTFGTIDINNCRILI